MDTTNQVSPEGPLLISATQALETPRRLNSHNDVCSLDSLAKFVETRKEDILIRHADRKDVMIYTDVDNCAIAIQEGIYGIEDNYGSESDRVFETLPTRRTVATTREHEEIDIIRELCSNRMLPGDLGTRLRSMKRYFVPAADGTRPEYERVVTALKQFNAQVDTTVTQHADDRAGKFEDSLKQLINSPDPVGMFELRFRILRGYGTVTTSFFIGRYPNGRGVSVQLQNFDLDMLVEGMKNKVLGDAKAIIVAALPEVPVLNVELV